MSGWWQKVTHGIVAHQGFQRCPKEGNSPRFHFTCIPPCSLSLDTILLNRKLNQLYELDTHGSFSAFFSQGRQLLLLPVWYPIQQAPSEKGSSPKGKHFLPCFLFKSPFHDGGKTNLTELSPLKMYPLPLNTTKAVSKPMIFTVNVSLQHSWVVLQNAYYICIFVFVKI